MLLNSIINLLKEHDTQSLFITDSNPEFHRCLNSINDINNPVLIFSKFSELFAMYISTSDKNSVYYTEATKLQSILEQYKHEYNGGTNNNSNNTNNNSNNISRDEEISPFGTDIGTPNEFTLTSLRSTVVGNESTNAESVGENINREGDINREGGFNREGDINMDNHNNSITNNMNSNNMNSNNMNMNNSTTNNLNNNVLADSPSMLMRPDMSTNNSPSQSIRILSDSTYRMEYSRPSDYKFFYTKDEIQRMSKKDVNAEILDIYLQSLKEFSRIVDDELLHKHVYYLETDGHWRQNNSGNINSGNAQE